MGVYSVISVAIVIMSSIVLLYILNKNGLLSKKIIHSIIIGSVAIILMSLFFPYIVGYLMNFPSNYSEASGFRLGISSAVIITFFFYMVATLFISIGISRLISNNSTEENTETSKASLNKVPGLMFKWIHNLTQGNLKPQENVQGLDPSYSPQIASSLENLPNHDTMVEFHNENIEKQEEFNLQTDIPQEITNNFQDVDLPGAAKQEENILEKPVDSEQNIDTMGIENVYSENIQSDENYDLDLNVVSDVLTENNEDIIKSESSDIVIESDSTGETIKEELENDGITDQEMVSRVSPLIEEEVAVGIEEQLSDSSELPEQLDAASEPAGDTYADTTHTSVDIAVPVPTEIEVDEVIENVIEVDHTITDVPSQEELFTAEDTLQANEEDVVKELKDIVETDLQHHDINEITAVESNEVPEEEIELQEPVVDFEDAIMEAAATEETPSVEVDNVLDNDSEITTQESSTRDLTVTSDQDISEIIAVEESGIEEIELQEPVADFEEAMMEAVAIEESPLIELDDVLDSGSENVTEASVTGNSTASEEIIQKDISLGLDEITDSIDIMQDNIENIRENIEESIAKVQDEYQIDADSIPMDHGVENEENPINSDYADVEPVLQDGEENNTAEDEPVEEINVQGTEEIRPDHEIVMEEDMIKEESLAINTFTGETLENEGQVMSEMVDQDVKQMAAEEAAISAEPLVLQQPQLTQTTDTTDTQLNSDIEPEIQTMPLSEDRVEDGTQLDTAEVIDNYIEEAFRLKSEGDLEGALVSYMYALERKPDDKLVFWIVLDTCVLYKQLGKIDLARNVLQDYLDQYGDVMDTSIKHEIEKNLQ